MASVSLATIGSDRTTVASTLAGIAQTVASEYQNISHKKISPSRPLSLSGGRAGAAALAEVNGAPLRVADTREPPRSAGVAGSTQARRLSSSG